MFFFHLSINFVLFFVSEIPNIAMKSSLQSQAQTESTTKWFTLYYSMQCYLFPYYLNMNHRLMDHTPHQYNSLFTPLLLISKYKYLARFSHVRVHSCIVKLASVSTESEENKATSLFSSKYQSFIL